MAGAGGGARAAGWLLLGCAAAGLGGCFERHEPANPFIGPFGSAEEGSFGALPAAYPAFEAALAQRAPEVLDLLFAALPWQQDAQVTALDLPRWLLPRGQQQEPGAATLSYR